MKNMLRAGASKRTMYALELADRRTITIRESQGEKYVPRLWPPIE
jgi:hypothetical protein